MGEDKNFSRSSPISHFLRPMLGVVVANSCFSSLFLGARRTRFVFADRIWIERPSAAAAAKKAFITTRIGDMGFFLASFCFITAADIALV